MIYLNKVNVGGQDNRLSVLFPVGTCATPAGTEIKACTFSDDFVLEAGCSIVVLFTYANTYGNGSSTYPKLNVNNISYPIKHSTGAYVGAGAWADGQIVQFMFDGTNFILGSGSGSGRGAGVSFIGTRAQYETAKLIPAGSEGHIPSGSLVIITDENSYIKGEEQE